MASNSGIVSIMLLLLLGAFLLPAALDAWFAVDTSGWGSTGDLWPIIPLLALLTIVLVQARKAEGQGSAA